MSYVTDWNLGSLATIDGSIGTIDVLDAQNVLTDGETDMVIYTDYGDFAYYNDLISNMDTWRNHNSRLIVDNVIVGTNQAADTGIGFSFTPVVVGSSSNLWGVTGLTARQVRRGSFGVAMNFCRHNSGGTLISQSKYVAVTGFKLDVPLGAVVTGIEAQVRVERRYAGPGIEYGYIYFIKMRAHYTYVMTLTGKSSSNGFLQIDEHEEPEISQSKFYQYLAYEDNVFRGQWRDVLSIPEITNAVDVLPGEMTVELARNLDSKETSYETIEVTGHAGQELATSQAVEPIMARLATDYAIGAGTDLEVDHGVKIREYYGGFENLMTTQGDLLLTSQGEQLQVANGHPRGREYYYGYVSDYGFHYGQDANTTTVKLLHISDELNNEIYKSVDTLRVDNYVLGANYIDFGGNQKNKGDIQYAGFNFLSTLAYKMKRLVVPISGWRDNIITATFRSGSTIGAGTIIGTATATISSQTVQPLSFTLPQTIAFTNGGSANVVFTSKFIKQTPSQAHPARIYSGPAYGNSTAYRYTNAWATVGFDLSFQWWEEGGNVRVVENSKDPSQIQKNILDYNMAYGGHVNYDQTSIVMSGTVVSAPFNENTLKEGGDYVLTLAPSDWHWFIDPGTLIYHLKPRPEDVDHWFTLGLDIIDFTPHKNIEGILNDLYFTGGGDPALFTRYVDEVSRSQWRKGLAKMSDTRVTDPTTAQIILQSEAGRASQPIWIGTLEVLRSEHPKIVKPNQLAGFRGFGNILDFISMQMLNIRITPDRYVIQLGTQPQKTSKRIEDIKRNLKRIEIESNPNNPT